MKQRDWGNSRGLTLIELLLSMILAAILIAGIYRLFIRQHRNYWVQEQIAEMQQNARVGVNRMIREIRMAGFGGKNENKNGNNDILAVSGAVNGFKNIINPENDVVENGITHDRITVIAACDQIAIVEDDVSSGSNTLKVNFTGSVRFDKPWKKYVCINGRDNYVIVPADGDVLTFEGSTVLREAHSRGEPVFMVKAIRYGLRIDAKGVPVLFRDLYPNTGGSQRDTVAEYIEGLRFRYLLADMKEVDVPENPKEIRGVKVTLQARTQMKDPGIKGGDGFYRRYFNTYIDIRNMRD